MRRLIFFVLFMYLYLVLHVFANCQIVNSGAKLTVSTASTYAIVKGDLKNQNNSILTNKGKIKLTGNWLNNNVSTLDLSSDNGYVIFCGASNQIIGGTNSTIFKNFEIINSADAIFAVNTTITGSLNLTTGILKTSSRILSLTETAAVNPAGGSATSFVDGIIKKTGNNAAFTFPTGDVQGATTVWAPLDIAAWNNTNDFTVNYTYKSSYDSLGYHTWQDGYSLGTGLDHVSGMEFWLIDRTGAGSQVPNVTLYWKDAVKNDILGNAIPNILSTDYGTDALADLTLVHWNSGTSKWDDMGGTATGIWPTGQITNSTAFTSYSPVTFGSKTGKNPLPIELIDFTATCNNSNVLIIWSTASEINNSHFSIERSTDAIQWDVIALVVGAGNSNQTLHYSHTDVNVSSEGLFYYRLGNINFNGVTEYSSIISTNCTSNNFEIISIYPNPVKDELHFLICTSENTEVIVSVTDVLGQILVTKIYGIEKGVNHLYLDISNFSSAIYFFKVETTNGFYKNTKQIVIDR